MVRDLTQNTPWKLIIALAIPLLLGNLFQASYNLVDTMIVGRYAGAEALAGVGVASPVFNLLNALLMGLSVGSSIIVSQLFGCRQAGGTSKGSLNGAVDFVGNRHCSHNCRTVPGCAIAVSSAHTGGGFSGGGDLFAHHFVRADLQCLLQPTGRSAAWLGKHQDAALFSDRILLPQYSAGFCVCLWLSDGRYGSGAGDDSVSGHFGTYDLGLYSARGAATGPQGGRL